MKGINKLNTALSKLIEPISHLFFPPDTTDEYVVKIMGTERKDLISSNDKATREKLEAEADMLLREAIQRSSSTTLTNTVRDLINEARSTISKRPLKPHAVMDKLDEVRLVLVRAYETRKLWPLFSSIVFLNIVYLGIFIWLIAWKSLMPPYSGPMNAMAAGIASCALWGGIGGVVDALDSLNYHVAKSRDFDKQYTGWYWLHPLLGGALGAIVYLVLQAGLATISNSAMTAANVTNTVAGNATGTVAGNGTGTVAVGVTAFSIAVAFLTGFKQMTAIAFLSRIVKSIFQKEDSEGKKPS